MNIVVLVIFLIVAMFIAGFLVNLYNNISSKKIKKSIVIAFWCIVIASFIILIAFLCNFFNLLPMVQSL